MRTASILVPSLALLVIASAVRAEPTAERTVVERELYLMGTRATVRVEAVDRRAALEASEAAVGALEATEARLSTWSRDRSEGSELQRLNRTAPDRPMDLSPALADELRRAQDCRRATGGAFDPGLGALVEAWGLRSGGRVPSSEELDAALRTGGAALELSDTVAGPAAIRRHAGLRIEEGGFGKGAGLDAALEILDADPAVFSAELDLGGQVAVLHSRGGDRSLPVVLAHPRHRGRAVARLVVDPRGRRASVATSGNSERGVVVDGRSLGHLLDPRTGRPVPDFGSLTVLAPRALEADCLATGLYVMGPERALAWAEAHEGIDVVVVRTPVVDGDGPLVIEHTSGMSGRVAPLEHGVRLVAATERTQKEKDSRPAEAGMKAGAGAGSSVASEVPSPRSPTDRGGRVAARPHASGADGNPRH